MISRLTLLQAIALQNRQGDEDRERVEAPGGTLTWPISRRNLPISADRIRSSVFLPRSLPSGPELVSAAPLAIEPLLELDLRHPSGWVQVDPFASRAADATPAAHKRQILKERRFDRQDVKPGHVPGAIDPFKHENLKKGRIVRVRGHGPQLRPKNPVVSNE